MRKVFWYVFPFIVLFGVMVVLLVYDMGINLYDAIGIVGGVYVLAAILIVVVVFCVSIAEPKKKS